MNYQEALSYAKERYQTNAPLLHQSEDLVAWMRDNDRTLGLYPQIAGLLYRLVDCGELNENEAYEVVGNRELAGAMRIIGSGGELVPEFKEQVQRVVRSSNMTAIFVMIADISMRVEKSDDILKLEQWDDGLSLLRNAC